MVVQDDDAPLMALAAKPITKQAKFDDDRPLSSLASADKAKSGVEKVKGSMGGKPGGPAVNRPSGAAAKAGAPKAKGRPGGKASLPGKRRASSSSSSDSSYSSSSSSSDEGPKGKKRGPNKGPNKGQKLKKLKSMKEEGEEDDGGGAVKRKDRTLKEEIVAELLCRWWYALPDWPPQDASFYQAELSKRSMRKVALIDWEWVPEVDEKGRKKVYELSQYRGCFRNSDEELIDLRPKDTCPCYRNFMLKDVAELYALLVKAYEKQLEDLKNSTYNETTNEAKLKALLTKVRAKASTAQQVGSRKN